MGDMGEGWDEHKLQRQAKKRSNAIRSTQILNDKGVSFTSHNGGIHLVIEHNNHVVDYWPSTGKFIFRDMTLTGRGVYKLLKKLEV